MGPVAKFFQSDPSAFVSSLALMVLWGTVALIVAQYRHLLGFVGLALLLGVPFCLRTFSSLLEVYPSVVLPSGAVLAHSTGATYRVDKTDLIGIDRQTGETRRIQPGDLLNPIPAQYFFRIADRKFGLLTDETRPLTIKYVPPLRGRRFSLPRKSVDEKERGEVLEWLRSRLEREGYDPSILIVRRTFTTVDTASLKPLSVETVDEKEIDLSR